MSDPYAWISPFEEIERRQRQVERAHEDGRRSVLRQLEGEAGKMFAVALQANAERLADRVTQEVIGPAARDGMAKWADTRERVGADIRRIGRTVAERAEMSVDALMVAERLETAVVTKVRAFPPFEYGVSTRLPEPRYR